MTETIEIDQAGGRPIVLEVGGRPGAPGAPGPSAWGIDVTQAPYFADPVEDFPDDLAEKIQDALDAAFTAGGGTVYLPPQADWVLAATQSVTLPDGSTANAALKIPAGVTLRGTETTVKLGTGTGHAVVAHSAAAGGVAGIAFDCTSARPSHNSYGLVANGSTEFYVDQVEAAGCSAHGIWIDAVQVSVTGIEVSGNTGTGVRFEDVERGWINGINASQNGVGVGFDGCSNLSIGQVTGSANTAPLVVDDCEYLTLTNTQMIQNTNAGSVEGMSASITFVGLAAIGCVTESGFKTAGATEVLIVGFQTSGNAHYGLSLTGEDDTVAISNDSHVGNTLGAVQIVGANAVLKRGLAVVGEPTDGQAPAYDSGDEVVKWVNVNETGKWGGGFGGISTHAAAVNGVHGVTAPSVIVGTESAQTLKNKTLDNSCVIANSDLRLKPKTDLSDPPIISGQMQFSPLGNMLMIGTDSGDTAYFYPEGSRVWQNYTPTLGGWTKAAAVITGRYLQVDKRVDVQVKCVMGAGMSLGTTPSFSLPVPIRAGVVVSSVAHFDDLGSTAYMGMVDASGSTAYVWGIGTNGTRVHLTTLWPFGWVPGDIVTFDLTYEAA